MLNAGLVQYVVVDDFLAQFWASVLPKLKLHPEVTIRTGGQIAWAIRKNSPLLKAELNAFLAKYPAGSAPRNMLFQKYLKSTKFVKNAAADEERRKLEQTVAVLQDLLGQVRHGLPPDGGAGLSGVAAEPEREESGRRGRRDAGHARHRQGPEGRRHLRSSSPTSTPA